MSSVLVVVIVGVSIVAITVATVRDGPKPATRDDRPRREPPSEPAAPVATPAPPPVLTPISAPTPPPVAPLEPWTPPVHRSPAAVAEPGRLVRARSAALLGVAVVALGSLAAALVGGTALVGYHMLRSALG